MIEPSLFWTLVGGLGVALITALGAIIVRKIRPATSEPEMWKRVDELTLVIWGNGADQPGLLARVAFGEQKQGAMERIIKALATQWEGEHPKLNPDDLALLSETVIPAEHPWRRKPPATGPIVRDRLELEEGEHQ